MCGLPANVVLAAVPERLEGYSIGSNDLTRLVLGLDRDSGTVAHLFDERDPAVRAMLWQAIDAAKRAGKPIGICGQAPSDYPTWPMARRMRHRFDLARARHGDQSALIMAEKEARQRRAAPGRRMRTGYGTDRRARSHRPAATAPRVRRCRPAAYASSAKSSAAHSDAGRCRWPGPMDRGSPTCTCTARAASGL